MELLAKFNMVVDPKSLTRSLHDNGDDHAVHSENTSHDHWDDRSEDKLGLVSGNFHDGASRFGSTESCAKICENKGRCNTKGTETKSLVGIAQVVHSSEVSVVGRHVSRLII